MNLQRGKCFVSFFSFLCISSSLPSIPSCFPMSRWVFFLNIHRRFRRQQTGGGRMRRAERGRGWVQVIGSQNLHPLTFYFYLFICFFFLNEGLEARAAARHSSEYWIPLLSLSIPPTFAISIVAN